VSEVKVYVQVRLGPEGAGDPIDTTDVRVYSDFGKALRAFQRTIEAYEGGDESSHVGIDGDYENASAWLRDGSCVFIDLVEVDAAV
jgi:hypothetical protein